MAAEHCVGLFIVTLGAFAYNKIMFEFIPELGSRAKAVCNPQGNQPFTILKISWIFKLYPNMPILLFKNILKSPKRVLI